MVALPSAHVDAYVTVRPFDLRRVLEQHGEDPDRLDEARKTLLDWLRDNPAHLPAAKADLDTLARAVDEARLARRERTDEARDEQSREASEMLRGIPAEDAFAAHTALRRLVEAAARAQVQGPPAEAAALPEPIPHLRAKLRHYQAEGVRFLLGRDLSAILADDMGLGKTVTAIAAVCAADARALVVSPANTLYNWRDEVERFTDEAPAVYHQGELQGDPDARFLLTTYDALRSLDLDTRWVRERDVLLLDEAHYVRNPRTLRARLVRRLPQERRLLLTGTPMVNGIEDYHALLSLVEPKRWGTLAGFKKDWLVEPRLYAEYAEVREATAVLLQRAASDVMLRRKKEDVLGDLPPRVVRVRHHEMSASRAAKYAAAEAEVVRLAQDAAEADAEEDDEGVGEALSAFHDLRQTLAKGRVRAAVARVRELLARGEEVVVFSHYLEPLRRMRKALGEDVAAMLDGSTPPEARQELATTFGEEGGPRVILAQLQAGGVGINLTAARHVLFLHFGWTPAEHAQAMDRVHRIGQDRTVFVEFFVTPGTVDERMAQILLRKEGDHNLVLEDGTDVHNKGELMRVLAQDAGARRE